MLSTGVIVAVSLAYLGLLFGIAYYGDRRADAGRSIISNPYVYALSLAVYCTGWTFFGSVGRAAETGVGFLPIYLGPTLAAALWWLVLRKMIRISRYHRLTSIADFVAARYGKSALLAGGVTLVAVFGIVPYIALQLKAAADGVAVLSGGATGAAAAQGSLATDTALYAALLLAAFTILFGTRHLDVTERHEGLVAAIAFESVVKLGAFLAVGLFVTYGLFDGFGDLFAQARASEATRALLDRFGAGGDGAGSIGEWMALTGLAGLAVLLLPRQFQVGVVENTDEAHVRKALWLFPLYLLAINVFVLPLALAGLLVFDGQPVAPDTFVLTLPMQAGWDGLALVAFLGGLSAAASMVVVATTALSTMICNDLVMPVLLRIEALRLPERRDLTGLLLGIRRASIVAVLLMGYGYYRLIGSHYTLVSIGLISFAAVAQFAPALLGGMFWKGGTRAGALGGLAAGFLVWSYCLPLPSLVDAGLVPGSFISEGPFGWALLRPYRLLGLDGLAPVPHALLWSLLANVGLYVGLSLSAGHATALEQSQARTFVDVFAYAGPADGTGDALHGPGPPGAAVWRGTAAVRDLRSLVRRFLGRRAARRALRAYAAASGTAIDDAPAAVTADADFVHYVEKLLAGAVGSASARAMVAATVNEEPVPARDVMAVLDEAQQTLAYSRALEQRSAELRRAKRQLEAANEQLKELDALKDDFVATVTHELRTPLTSIRAFAEILHQHPDLDAEQRQDFLGSVVHESERLSRLIGQVLTLQRVERGGAGETFAPVPVADVVREAVRSIRPRAQEKGIELVVDVPGESSGEEPASGDGTPALLPAPLHVPGRADELVQAVTNLLANAAKFAPNDGDGGCVRISARGEGDTVRLAVADDGPGIPAEEQAHIFERFRQGAAARDADAGGSGLGLAIVQRIVRRHGGEVSVESAPGAGATFTLELPLADSEHTHDASPPSSVPAASQ